MAIFLKFIHLRIGSQWRLERSWDVGTERGERVIVLAKAFCTIVYEGWIRKCHIIQNLNSQAWTELRLFQDSNRYHLAKRLWYGEDCPDLLLKDDTLHWLVVISSVNALDTNNLQQNIWKFKRGITSKPVRDWEVVRICVWWSSTGQTQPDRVYKPVQALSLGQHWSNRFSQTGTYHRRQHCGRTRQPLLYARLSANPAY